MFYKIIISTAIALTLGLTSCSNKKFDEDSYTQYASMANPKETGEGIINGVTHSFIVESGLRLASSAPKLSSKGRFFLTKLNKNLKNLQIAASSPDWDEADVIMNLPTFRGHFYFKTTKENYFRQPSPNAKERFVEHVNLVTEALTANDFNEVINQVGRASHYLADSCEPHHASNRLAYFSTHMAYEAYIDNKLKKDPEPLRLKSFTPQINLEYGDLVERCAEVAFSISDKAEATMRDSLFIGTGPVKPDYKVWDQAIAKHFPITQEMQAHYLYKLALSIK